MNKTKQFASYFAAAALLIGTSAFAESRHSDATARDGGRHDRGDRTNVERRNTEQRNTPSYQQQRTETRNWNNNNQNRSYDRSYNNNNRSYDRNRTYDRSRTYDRNRSYDNRGYDRNRGYDNRGYDRNRGYSQSYGRGNAFYRDGRISRIERWNGGYRIWLGGWDYPYFVPEARFRLFNWRVGLSIHLGGFWNPLGYYDYYDGVDPYYAGGYAPGYAGTVATSGYIRGVVESVDYRRGSMVIRDDASGSFVTVMMRGEDPRFDSLRNGDYVNLSGDWVRGYFEAYRVDNVDDGYYRR